jgi:hypothetical protein
MRALNHIHQFIGTKIFILLLFSIPLLISCQKSDDSNQTYLGKQNTIREYETNEWQYEVNTTIPYIKVPDSYYKNLSYDSIPISQGLTSNLLTTEKVNPYDITSHSLNDPELIKSVLEINSEREQYYLEFDLNSIENNREFTKNISSDIALWKEDSKELSIIFSDTSKYTYLVKPLYVGSEWIRDSYKYIDNGVPQVFQLECKVLGIEHVSVKAGEFSAYKVQVLNHWVDIPSESVRGYEYYVPDVGLVLEERDGTLHEARIPPMGSGGETTFYVYHQILRKELTSYNFVKY